MHILVLGGTRFIGLYAVRRLVVMGHKVAVFHRGQTEAALPSSVHHLHGDRERLMDFVNDFRDFAPEIILDMVPATERDGKTLVSLFNGPGDYQHRLFHYLKRMDDKGPAILLSAGVAKWRGLRGYVEDIGESIALCAVNDQAAGRVYHVAEQDNPTEAEWVRRLARAAEWNGEIVILPDEHLPPHLRRDYDISQDWSLDSSRIRRELGYDEPTSPDEAMRRSVAWERANPPKDFDPAEFDYTAEDAALAAHNKLIESLP